jgi:dTDP-glucose 4,6-dehydratase
MKTILITGAGGAIGVHLIAHILEITNWRIIAVDSFKSEHKGYFDRLANLYKLLPPEMVKEDTLGKRLTILTHDLNAPFTERELAAVSRVDYIVNLASRSDVQNSIDDPLPFVRNNTELMLNILEAARVLQPETFLHFSTDEVYGPAPKDSGGHKEWDTILPSNPYSASKAAQEAYAIAWWRSFNLPLILTNTMNNFGEMQAPSKFPAMIQQKLEAGEEIIVHAADDGEVGTRFYLHSRNSADAIVFILRNVPAELHTPGELDRPVRLNIVGDKQVSNEELVVAIAELMEKDPNYRKVNFHDHNPGHDLHYGLDGAELTELGWVPPETFEESMARTIEWQRKNPEWMK